MDDDAPLPTTARLLGSYWLDSSYWHPSKPCCCFAPPPPRRVRGRRLARTVLTVAAYGLILTALALTAAN
ncbi:hypothetical protein [Streptomyces collinus]|uniref:hypothetical protein n=1 Tax=Streptomyces collinus TaxID=42684 RepID=UPI002943D856|nr:hypothetical protein [Streptomyces collinus]